MAATVADPNHPRDEASRLARSRETSDHRRLLHLCADALAREIGGNSLRVAILRLVGGQEFVFAHPPELCGGNRFPARPSLAGRVLSQGALVENSVPERAHFSLYERIPQRDGEPRLIQKMIALPVPGASGPIGAVQVSRCGATPDEAGPDFVQDDVARATAALAPYAPLLERIWKEDAS